MCHKNEHLLMSKANTFTISIQFGVINDSDLHNLANATMEWMNIRDQINRILLYHAKPRYQNEQGPKGGMMKVFYVVNR